MTNSHLLGFLTFGGFAFFALLLWWGSRYHPATAGDPAARRKARRVAPLLLLGGAAFGYYAFVTDYQMRVTTLAEIMVPGSTGASPGVPAPEQIVSFQVEHPGITHQLFLSPTADLLDPPNAPADITFSLHSPSGEAVLPEKTERFTVLTASRNQRADWEGKTFAFTPPVPGTYTVRVRPRTAGIPLIQVRIVDPLKRNGQRMSGY